MLSVSRSASNTQNPGRYRSGVNPNLKLVGGVELFWSTWRNCFEEGRELVRPPKLNEQKTRKTKKAKSHQNNYAAFTGLMLGFTDHLTPNGLE